jgi:magnesium transporter
MTIGDNLFTQLDSAIDSDTLNKIKHNLNNLSPPDIAHQLETAPPRYRHILWGLINKDISGAVLHDLSDEIQFEFLTKMDGAEVALITEGLKVNDAVDILQHLPEQVIPDVLKAMSAQDRHRIETVLTYDEDTAGGLMDTEIITVRPDISVDVVLRYLRRFDQIPDTTDNLFVVNRDDEFLGNLSIGVLLTSSPTTMISDVMNTGIKAINVDLLDSEVAIRFQRYNLISAPVINKNNRLLGRITIDDVVDVITDDADHSLLAMAGLSDTEDTFSSIRRTAPRRAIWLGVNLFTAILASSAISIFTETLDKLVALAILMPIVASMGGVAGSQTLTVVIRGMALGQVEKNNLNWLMSKEFSVGAANGIFYSLIVGGVVSIWFQDGRLAIIMGLAMAINLMAAALTGTILPVALRSLSIDPALAGSVILTTITDVVGFVSFLGLAAVFLL